MRDSEISRIFGINQRTIANWKTSEDWRLKLYTYLSLKTVEEVAPEIERVNKILESKKKAS